MITNISYFNSFRACGASVRPVYVSTPRREKQPRITDLQPSSANGRTWKMLLGERLIRPTIYYAAYLTALAVKDDAAAEKLLGIAKTMIEN
jgi:hypothetical protein